MNPFALTPEREHIMGFEGCRVKGCSEPHRAKGFCARHYNRDRWRRMKELRARAERIVAKAARANARARKLAKAGGKRR